MDEVEKVGLRALLSAEVCGLNHGPERATQPATDWLVVPLGLTNELNVSEVHQELTIPVCNECLNELMKNESEWVLLYCLDCCSSQWVARSLSRLSWVNKQTLQLHKVLWLRGCPCCTNKLTSISYA